MARIICACEDVIEVETLAFDVEQMAKESMRFFGKDKHREKGPVFKHVPVFAAFRKKGVKVVKK